LCHNVIKKWSKVLSAEMINRSNAFLKRLKRFGYIECLLRLTI